MKKDTFTTITNKELKREVDNIIDKAVFAKFYQAIELQNAKRDDDEVEYLIELFENQNDEIKNGNIATVVLNQLKEIETRFDERRKTKEKAYELEDAFYDEISQQYEERANDGYRTYNVEYFEERLNLFRLSGFTEDFTPEEKQLQKASGFLTPKEK